jgi:hypothetical protein
MSTNASVVGKALYLEMHLRNYTTQILFTPEGITSSGKVVPMSVYKRRISPTEPRKSWRHVSSMHGSDRDGAGKVIQLGKDHALSTVRDRLSFTDSLFNQLIIQGWTLFKQPIVVEVSPEDLDDIRAGKTPYKILGRVTRSRRHYKFPETLFSE